MNNEPLRPDPDRLLEQTAAPHRGKLKVFFVACAGVGKTWEMLAEAQRLRAQGLDIVVGVVETHGRKDTAAMLEGLAVLPLKRQAYRGRHISEFDLDAADDVVLVDLPPDDLRQRLKEGKVYIAGQAERAIEHFFRKGNLIALRELALRRTADRVDEQMRAWRGHPLPAGKNHTHCRCGSRAQHSRRPG